MIFKRTFSNRIFDWVIICTAFFFLILGFMNLLLDFQFIHSEVFPRLILFLLSLYVLISFVVPGINGERTTHLFIGGVLILPAIVSLFQFVVELLFSQNVLYSYIADPFLYFKLLFGTILLFLSLKFSRKKKSKWVKDLGIFLAGLGIYVVLFLLVRTVESIFRFVPDGFVLWETIVKAVLGISLVITGLQVRYRKLGYSMGLILTALVFVIFFVL